MARRWLYDVGWLPTHAPPLPTFCVGGLEAGGSGKTPVTEWLLRWLLTHDARPGLLTRGYGRKRPVKPLVVRQPGERASPADVGDEAAMLIDMGLDVPVAASPKRLQGAQALARLGCRAIVMDDGFAHRALGRHLDVVVLRADAPLGNGHLLPWGTLREPPSSLRRAHVVWLHHKHTRDVAPLPPDSALRRFFPQAHVVQSRTEYTLEDAAGAPLPLPAQALVAACGVAHPEGFHRALRQLGAHIGETVVFGDHHRYGPADVARLLNIMTRCEAKALVVTAKDAVKLREYGSLRQSLLVLRARVQVVWGMTHFVTSIKSVMKQ